MNQKGQELSTSTIILIILGVIILVVMVVGFTIGWNKIIPYVSSSNINTIQTQCLAACSTNSVYDFCSRPFDLNSGTATIKNSTCNYLAAKQGSYGIAACPAIPCSNTVLIDNPKDSSGHYQYTKDNFNSQSLCADTSNSGKALQALIGDTLYTISC